MLVTKCGPADLLQMGELWSSFSRNEGFLRIPIAKPGGGGSTVYSTVLALERHEEVCINPETGGLYPGRSEKDVHSVGRCGRGRQSNRSLNTF